MQVSRSLFDLTPIAANVLRILFVCLLVPLVGCATDEAPNADETRAFDEPSRPQFHFSPAKNWMNDPNGMVYHAGEYHLFYQYNPFGEKWGHMSWGHAVSPDLVNWEHLPVALYEEDGVMIFSGSAVVDHQNTSGFGTPDNPPMVAIYTGHEENVRQTQHIAYSTDNGRNWTKYADNPVIDLNMKDFRDPKVFWHDDTDRWIMVVALPREYKVQLYASPDLKAWTFLSDFGPAGSTDGIWECPDLFELPIEGEAGSRWVLEVDIGSGAIAGGSGGQYFVGTFDGTTFTNDNPDDLTLWVDYGADFYAGVSWADIPEADGRRIFLAWMNNWQYAQDIPTSPWRSAQSLPRTLQLRNTPDGLRLTQRAVRELQGLRSDALVADESMRITSEAVIPGAEAELLEFSGTLQLNDATAAGLTIRHGDGDKKTLIGYDAAREVIYVDRTQSGISDFHEDFAAIHEAPLKLADGTLSLHVFVDRSSVEVLADGGLVSITDRIFPEEETHALELWANEGAVDASAVSVWSLNSIYE
ncbi:MAG: glycoside hydrolase family 32 protein [Bacteroidota bacterium]